jgi:pyrophosphatase PpaX
LKKDYRYYLFDADGTLIDTIGLIVRCFEHTCGDICGVSVPKKEIQKNVGLTLRKQMELYLGPMTDERFELLRNEHMDFQLKHYREYLRLFPGVAEGLSMLSASGKHLAVVTSRRRDSLELYLRETGIYHYFEAIVTLETTERHKPDPQPAMKALSLLGGNAKETLFIGDASFDIECAKNAGMDCAFVTWSYSDLSEMIVQPTFCIGDLRQLC